MKVSVMVALAGLAVSACTSSLEKSASTTVQLAGATYIVTQLTAGTWTAMAAGPPKAINTLPPGKPALLQAIEQASGCRVTDSDYSRQGMQLDAQVDCGSRLKN